MDSEPFIRLLRTCRMRPKNCNENEKELTQIMEASGSRSRQNEKISKEHIPSRHTRTYISRFSGNTYCEWEITARDFRSIRLNCCYYYLYYDAVLLFLAGIRTRKVATNYIFILPADRIATRFFINIRHAIHLTAACRTRRTKEIRLCV